MANANLEGGAEQQQQQQQENITANSTAGRAEDLRLHCLMNEHTAQYIFKPE